MKAPVAAEPVTTGCGIVRSPARDGSGVTGLAAIGTAGAATVPVRVPARWQAGRTGSPSNGRSGSGGRFGCRRRFGRSFDARGGRGGGWATGSALATTGGGGATGSGSTGNGAGASTSARRGFGAGAGAAAAGGRAAAGGGVGAAGVRGADVPPPAFDRRRITVPSTVNRSSTRLSWRSRSTARRTRSASAASSCDMWFATSSPWRGPS